MVNIKNPGCAAARQSWALEFNRFAVGEQSRIAVLPRNGMTLVEVILVLALLVVIGAVSAPLLEGSFTRARLEHGGDLVRAAWTRARLAAAESATTYVFRCEPNGSRYQIVTLAALSLPETSILTPDITDERAAADMLRLGENRLPDGVVFSSAEIAASAEVAALVGETAGTDWSSPILFRPDGTTSDASVILTNSEQQTLRVTLRGLTGVSRTSDMTSEAQR
jgi:prepilin-type N-terminal cleavage/methylation domain-containing protein